jgi:tetratricopeptide (TPR) repeat protein
MRSAPRFRPLRTKLLVPLLAGLLAALPAGCDPAATAAPDWAAIEALVQSGDLAGARAQLEALRSERGDEPELVVRLAQIQRAQGQEAAAVLLLRGTVQRAPTDGQLVGALARLQFELGDAAGARDGLLAARRAGLDTGDVALLLGTCLGRLREDAAALAELDRARELGAEPEVVDYNRALLFGQAGRHAEAVLALEAALQRKPDWAPARREHARALLAARPGDRPTAESALDELVAVRELLPSDWRVMEGIGDAWMVLDDAPAALQAYEEALRLGKNPLSVEERYRVAARRLRDQRAAAGTPPAGG